MIGHASPTLPHAAPKQDMFYATNDLVNGSSYATLILDGFGKIISCDAPTEGLFGASQADLAGRWISAFFESLRQVRYSARYLIQHFADCEWRKLALKNTAGRELVVELHVTRRMTDGREIFLLTLRQPREAIHH